MAVRPRGDKWQADVAYKGSRHRETFDTEAAALEWEHLARAALKRGKPLPERAKAVPENNTIGKLLQTVIAVSWSKQRGSTASIIHAQRFVDFVGPSAPIVEALSQVNLDAFVVDLMGKAPALSGSTINRHLSAISKLSKRAFATGLIPRPLIMEWQKEGEARLSVFTDEQEALILQTLHLWSLPRWADFFIVLVDTGLRTWTEAGRLPWQDIAGNPRILTIHGDKAKNGVTRGVPLTSRAWEAIQRQSREGAGPFTDLDKDAGRRLWDRLRLHLGMGEDYVWYTARHTFASRLVQRGVDLFRVQRLMGHKSPTMTQKYAKFAPQHLIDAVSVLEPAPLELKEVA